jgi:hypothetical protein
MEDAMNKVSFEGIGEWFTGKAAEKAKWAVDQINASLAEGEWLPGVSRTVKAALDKINAKAQKIAKMADQLEKDLPYASDKYPDLNAPGAIPGLKEVYRSIYWLLKYGSGKDIDLNLLAQHANSPESKEVLAAARRALAGRQPIVEAIAFLDAQRPKPVFVFKTLSPTGAKLLLDAGYKPDTAQLPIFRYYRDEDGNPEMEIIWPEGTKHGKSRFKHGTKHNFQCHACGHAIKNALNWVPLHITTETGEIHSFWVGRDCAKKLFGVEMKGDAKYLNTDGR